MSRVCFAVVFRRQELLRHHVAIRTGLVRFAFNMIIVVDVWL
jgi:hypothetical protein